MSVTKVYNKITLREHPDLSPVADSSFQKGHSFIFPGDELVLCTKLNMPTDIGAFSKTVFNSVKMSIIAEKPNIFTEEFSSEFTSTRKFELDSITVPLTALNAPRVPWGTDGYAPNVNFTQDRNWTLPSGDFKRQIKAFTTHTPSTSEWDWNFWFPIIFREEYWQALAAADNDFYDPLQPQNGKNEKWLRYHNLAALPFGWIIKFRFELFYTTIRSNKLITEYSLSNEQTGIQDYSSNADFTAKTIKTCSVGGTPSSTCFIFGYQNTSCFGYLTKTVPWDSGEKNNLTAVFRLRPFESGDRLGSRASSVFPITSDVVWSAKAEHIKNNNGLRIKTNDNKELVTNKSGSTAVKITFDPADDKKITIQADIDYTKLNTIFPGVTKFTLYCRLYNGTKAYANYQSSIGGFNVSGNQFVAAGDVSSLYIAGIPTGFTYDSVTYPEGWSVNTINAPAGTTQNITMNVGIGSGTVIFTYVNAGVYRSVYFDMYSSADRMGEEITTDAVFISTPGFPVKPIPSCDETTDCPSQETLCKFVLDVFADINYPADDLRNDKSDFYGYKYMGNAGISNIQLTLQKNADACGGCSWVDKVTIALNDSSPATNSLYGQYFPFGKSPDFYGTSFTDDYGNKYTGLLLYWKLVLAAFGAGQYRMKIVYTSAIDGSTATDYDIRIFCLHQWNCHNIDGTVRIETVNSGFRGTMFDNTLQIDYFKGWYGQTRVKGIFYEGKPNYNKEFNQYGDGDFNVYKPIIHELIPKFTLDVKPSPGWIDWLLSNYILLSDSILITDYNASNRKTFVKFPVINDGGIETKDDDFVNPLALSKLSFSYAQNNLRRRNDGY